MKYSDLLSGSGPGGGMFDRRRGYETEVMLGKFVTKRTLGLLSNTVMTGPVFVL